MRHITNRGRWTVLLAGTALVLAAGNVGAPVKARDAGFWASPSLRLTRVTSPGASWFAPVPSPDGRWLAVQRQTGRSELDDRPVGRVWLLRTPTRRGPRRAPRQFSSTTVSNTVTWSPASDALAWDTTEANAALRNSIRVRSLDAAAERALYERGPNRSDFLPAWSPAGKEVVFYSTRKNPLGLWLTRPGGEPRIVAHFPGWPGSDWMGNPPAWSSDGKWLAVERDQENGGQEVKGARFDRRLWVYSRDGQRAYRLGGTLRHTTNPTWSPNSRQLAYAEQFEQVFVAPPNAGQRRRLWRAPRGTQIVDLRWSPRGRRLLASVRMEGAARPWVQQVWQVDARTGKAKQLLRAPAGWFGARWMPDGKGFYVVRTGGAESHVWQAVFQ